MPSSPKIPRELILENALKMLIRDGYSALNIKALAKEIGCSTQPISWHFGNMEGLRTALAEYALNYANDKMTPSAEDATDAFVQVGIAYIQIALLEPNLFKFLYMNGDSRFSLPDFEALKSYDGHRELVKKFSAAYHTSEEKIGRYIQHTVIYTHGIATLVAAGIVKASGEEIMQMIDYAGNSFRIQEGIPLEQMPYAEIMQKMVTEWKQQCHAKQHTGRIQK